ncbi:MAG: hypothetical protein LBE79_04535 [Tannerella sp.]|jgi:hypothetical protein|nr:hypothetical protein [Tannerella sp.]
MKQVLFILCTLLFSILAGCSDIDNHSLNPNHRLSFSVDTLSFDTVFTTIGSATKQFLVYNPNNEALKIESIMLASGGKSGFRFNVDGRKGDSFQGIEIWKKDSLYVSVEITVNPNGMHQPVVIEDSILFLTNGIRQYVLLQAYGQDIHIMKGGVVITHDTTFTADLPYLIYDSLVIAGGVTANIAQGAIFYMYHNASVIISGTVKAKGTHEKPIVFRGNRLDYIPTHEIQIPYDVIPGQWGGIFFNDSSFDNEFDHVIVRNGMTGLTFRESVPDRLKISINNSQITNMDSTLFAANNCYIESANSEFSNSSGSTVTLMGGKYQFTHCTLANYKGIGKGRSVGNPCLMLLSVQNQINIEMSYSLRQAYFDNCIIDGNWPADSTKQYGGEIRFASYTLNSDETMVWPDEQGEAGNDETFNYRFTSCLIKTARVNSDRFLQCLFVTSPTFWKIGTREEEFVYDFRLANESVGIGAANRTISENYPADRYGVNRLTSSVGPSIGAYEFIESEEGEK